MKKILLACVVCLLLLPVCLASSQEKIQLPQPQFQKTLTLGDAINKAHTDKVYKDTALRLADLSLIVWAASGKRLDVDAVSNATFVSYDVRLYVLVGNVERIDAGIYEYVPNEHALKLMKKGDFRAQSVEGTAQSYAVTQAPATVVMAADLGASAKGERPIVIEAAFLAQTVRMVAPPAGVGVGMVTTVDPAVFGRVFGTKDAPLIFLPLGYSYP